METAAELQDALSIPMPDSEALVLDSCRRLMGPNMYAAAPGAVGDALIAGFDNKAALASWAEHARQLAGALGWTDVSLAMRLFDGGASLYLPAPIDQLFTAAYVIEAAWHYCAHQLLDQSAAAIDEMVEGLKDVSRREANPALVELAAMAQRRGLDLLLDDDAVTIGHGSGARTWATDALPTPGAVGWQQLHDIPVALVTGTNGKTTTTRLAAAMARADGLVSGLSSTEFVKVGDEILDRGDYSGPAGGRLLLRDRRLEVGILEVARGGILRRGLPVSRARAAVVTNVAADHLGHYGITTVAELATVKFAVRRALGPDGVLILNADDPLVVAEASREAGTFWWFSLDPGNPLIVAAQKEGLPCGWLDDEKIILFDGKDAAPLVSVSDVPLAMGGAARYNILNALAAGLLSRALGVGDGAIRAVLTAFRSDPADNPGRCNEFDYNGARVFVDFAHNPHSIAAVTSALAALPARRRFVLLSHAGDRSDQDIRDLSSGAFAMRPDYVVVAEIPSLLRGRQLGEIPGLIRSACLANGLAPDHVLSAASPADGARRILDMVQPGDLALLLVHSDRAAIFRMLGVDA